MNASDDLKESRALFLAESGDYLELLNEELLKLEKIEDRESQSASINNMFRAAHSIKGMSGMMGFTKINRLTHKMENILDNIRQGKQRFADETIELLFKCFDLLTALVSAVSQNETEDETVDIEDAISEIEEILSGRPHPDNASSSGSGPGFNLTLSISEQVRSSLKDFEDLNLFIAERSPDNIFEIELSTARDADQKHQDYGAFWISLKQMGEIVHCTPNLKSIAEILKTDTATLDSKIHIVYQTGESAEKISGLLGHSRISIRDLRKPFASSGSRGKEESKFEKSAYLNIFVEESYEDIEKMNEALLELERNPDDSENFNTVMRVMHSLKSSSAAVGFNNISTLAHAVESLLVALKNSKNTITSEIITLLLGSIDGIRNFLALAAEGKGHEIDLSEDVTVFRKLIESHAFSGDAHDAAWNFGDAIPSNDLKLNEYESALLAEGLETGKKAYRVDVAIEEEASMKAMRYLLVVSNYKENGDVIKCVPGSEEEFEKKNALNIALLFVSGEDDVEKIKKLGDVDQIKEITVAPYVIERPSAAARDSQGRHEEELEVLRPAIKKAEKALNSAMDTGIGADSAGSQTLRVELGKLDNLINLIGELVIIKASFFQISNRLNTIFLNKRILYNLEDTIYDLERKKDHFANESAGGESMSFFDGAINSLKSTSVELKDLFKTESYIIDFNSAAYKLGKIINNLQTGIMGTRMVQVGQLFKRFHRVVRDLGKQQNKKVNLEIRGEETELDKKVIDELGNPLTHIIRNAVDHAIEFPEERLAANKSEEGTVFLNAYHEGSNICIDVEDNGRGINSEKVLKKAIEKGIITESEAANLTRQEIVALIFMPGFSTAEKVTDISGRGVGMDIVKKSLENLKGSIVISSEEGRGTKITIRLPLTLAIISSLLIRIADAIFALPLESVLEITKIAKSELHAVEGNLTIKLRDKILSIVELADAIGITQRTAEGNYLKVVVVSSANKMIGICVDELIGKEEVVIKSLSEDFKKVEGISGASVLGDGKVSLILDVPAIVKRVSKEF